MFNNHDAESRIFHCVDDYATFGTGRKKQKVAIGNGPDARTCGILVVTVIRKNHPSQRSKKFPEGYIEFENGKRFDLARSAYETKHCHIFAIRPEIEDIWRAQKASDAILLWSLMCRTEDLIALAELILEVVEPGKKLGYRNPDYIRKSEMPCLVRRLVRLGGVNQSENIEAMLAAGGGSQNLIIKTAA